MKMKSSFNWLDNDRDGYLTEKDFLSWATEIPKLFPDMTEEQKKVTVSTINDLWSNVFGGKEKPDPANYSIRYQRTHTLKGVSGLQVKKVRS